MSLKEFLLRRYKSTIFVSLSLVSVILGVVAGLIFASLGSYDIIASLEDYRPSIVTTVYSDDGEIIKELAWEKRTIVTLTDIPAHLQNAVVTAEDKSFHEHFGIDVVGIFRAFFSNILSMRVVQGGSTLTQQLSKNIFLTPEQTLERKIKEAIYSVQIEKYYSKGEILELYCNQIFMGYTYYGMAAASQFYFGVPLKDLSLSQCALLAGIIRSPNRYSPFKNPQKATDRRNHVLARMAEEGFISAEQAEAGRKEPLNLRDLSGEDLFAPYFVEEIKKYLEKNYDKQVIYEKGLRVFTTLDRGLQEAAEGSLKTRLKELDKRQGFRKIEENIFLEGHFIDSYHDASWSRRFKPGISVRGVVSRIGDQEADIRIGDQTIKIDMKAVKWTRKRAMKDVFKRGDLPLFLIDEMDEAGQILSMTLDQIPVANAALVSVEVGSGAIKAMVGGYNFNMSNFNCAVQAGRQAGSAFKPIYYCAAFARGFRPTDIIFDQPTVFVDPQTEVEYIAKNYKIKNFGITTLREALEQSRNIVSVKLFDLLGINPGLECAKKLGIKSKIYPYLSSALGASEVNLLEMTAAYAVFPGQGLRFEPYFIKRIETYDDDVLEEHMPRVEEVITPEVAYLVNHVLKGVVDRGTAVSARSRLKGAFAGKTGTVDDYRDAWFIGYSPSLTCGVWVGFTQEMKSLGRGETGARAALPIWIDFFEAATEGREPEEFEIPRNIVFRRIDYKTGLLAVETCPKKNVIYEAFIRGTEPIQFCSPREDYLLSLPWEEQKKLLMDDPLPPPYISEKTPREKSAFGPVEEGI